MKPHIETLLKEALQHLQIEGVIAIDVKPVIQINHPRDPQHGDFSTNLALLLAKSTGLDVRVVAEHIITHLPPSPHVQRAVVAGPGFINFFLENQSIQATIPLILQQGVHFGESDQDRGQRVHIEFVSSNPTGPLHVGHGRSAAYGASIANLLQAVGFQVHREYYVNDAGRQMQILTLSVWLRYLQLQGKTIDFPSNAYQGQYIVALAQQLQKKYDQQLYHPHVTLQQAMIKDLHPTDDKETYLDALIQVAQQLLGQDHFHAIFQLALCAILDDIKEDLQSFGVVYDRWFYESELTTTGLVQAGIQRLNQHETVYEKEGAQWFRATQLGDEKDRVLIRKNGQSTYFASDVAYHLHKYQEGYDRIIDVLGADHHGYVPRIRAFLQGLGEDPHKLSVLIVQFVSLYRGKERIAMTTRGGSFVTLRELREEVGNDAARFFYISRKPEQHMDFDLELAKSQSNENPVYYIQYAHARICSVWRELTLRNLLWDKEQGLAHTSLLTTSHEKELLNALARYPETITHAALNYEPHLLAHYLQELANHFHTYYNAQKFLVEDAALRNARLCLLAATRQVLVNGLTLLGVSAPEKM